MENTGTNLGKGSVKRLTVVSLLVIVSGALAILILVVLLNQGIRTEQRNECLNSLQQIDSALMATALERGYRNGDSIPTAQLVESLKDNKIPSCPSGGSYVIPPVGGHPTCTFHGDLLAREGKLAASRSSIVQTGAVSNK